MSDSTPTEGDKLPAEGVLLGLDYGKKRIGVAATDPLRLASHPIGYIKATDESRVWEELKQIIADKEAVGIAIGLPLTLDGKEKEAAKTVRAWAEEVRGQLNLPAVLIDERMSTKLVDRAFIEGGVSQRKRKQRIDAAAACAVLQTAVELTRRGI